MKRDYTKFHVVLDTNVLRADPSRTKAGFTALTKLTTIGLAQVHIPYYVFKEFTSQQTENYWKSFNDAVKGVSEINRRRLSFELSEEIEGIRNRLSELGPKLEKYVRAEFGVWCKESSFHLCSLDDLHAHRVTDAYFEGNYPFSKAKARNDIPDAFIFEQIRDLSAEFDLIYAIVGDNRLRDACGTLGGVQVFTSLDEFIQTEICRDALLERDITDRIGEILAKVQAGIPLLIERVGAQLEINLPGKTFLYESWDGLREIATVEDIRPLSRHGLEIERLHYYGNGLFLLPFRAKLSSYISRPIERFHLERLSDIHIDEFEYYDDENSTDSSVFGKGEIDLIVSGNISVSLDIKDALSCLDSDGSIEPVLANATMSIDKIRDIRATHE